jgi:hypothetical protein
MIRQADRVTVAVFESFRDYSPPSSDVSATVHQLLDALPPQYVGQLQSVVLTNHAALSRQARRRRVWAKGRKFEVRDTLGSYMPAWRGERPWIQLLIDQIFDARYGPWLRLRYVRTMMLARPLYHEVGHHLHATLYPDARDREAVADQWSDRLRRDFHRRQYWYLPPWPVTRWVLRPLIVASWFLVQYLPARLRKLRKPREGVERAAEQRDEADKARAG